MDIIFFSGKRMHFKTKVMIFAAVHLLHDVAVNRIVLN